MSDVCLNDSVDESPVSFSGYSTDSAQWCFELNDRMFSRYNVYHLVCEHAKIC